MVIKVLFTHILAVFLSLSCSALTVSVGAFGADYTTDGTNDEVEIQAAINAVSNSGGGIVTLLDGTYNIQTTYILPKSNVILSGTSRDGTILSSTRTFGNIIYSNNVATTRFWIQNLTIDALNANSASGIRLEKVSNTKISNVKFTHVTCNGWDLVIGIDGSAAGTANDFSRDILIENCLFDGHKGSLEMVLLFNTKNCRIENCTFQNKTTGCSVDGNRPVLGLWQKTDSISILQCTFLNNNSREAIYHSNTCDNTLIENCTFTNTGGIHGSNESDWGTFGIPFEKRLVIRNCTMTAGSNDLTETAIKLGAIEGVLIKDCNITGYEEGIVIQNGLSSNLPYGVKHFAVVRTNIRDGNPANNVHALHPGILFQKIGGKQHGFFICGDISSSLSPPKQEQPVAFTTSTSMSFDSLFWLGTTITAYNTRPDVKFLDFATQGSPFVIEKCNGSNPPSYCSDCATMTNADIEAKIRAYDIVTADIMHGLLNYQPTNIVLPVELLFFMGKNEKQGNYLSWHFANTKDLESVEIQKSIDGKNFNIFFVLNKFDEKILDEYYFAITYYRLKMNNTNGSSQFSKTIVLTSNEAKNVKIISISPNPTDAFLDIQFETPRQEAIRFEVFNALGQLVFSEKMNTLTTSKRLNTEGLPAGIYSLKISTSQTSVTHKFFKK